MDHVSRSQSISWFQDKYGSGHLTIRPPFQRKPVWAAKQKCALIESILLAIPIPEIYVQATVDEDGAEQFAVVDGQQRLRTILQFAGVLNSADRGGETATSFILDTLPDSSAYKGKSFADITGKARQDFYQYEICVRYLKTDDMKTVEDVFKRLNKFTMPLKPQELRNATFHGAFAKMAEQLADDEYWVINRIVSPAAIRRMSDIEMMSDLMIGLIHGPQGGSSKILDGYYEQYEQYDDEFPEQIKIRRIFLESKTTIKQLFPNISDVPRWGNKADYYSLFIAFGDLLQGYQLTASKQKKLQEALLQFAEDIDKILKNRTSRKNEMAKKYARAIEKGSNDKARRADRHNALINVIEPFLIKKI